MKDITYEEAKQKKEEAYKTWREKTIKIEETWDGSGNYGLEDKISNISVDCSEISLGNIRKEFTHVWWYNK